jgi:PAS domain S-box-containing protein
MFLFLPVRKNLENPEVLIMEKLNVSLLYIEDDPTLRNIYRKILEYSVEKVFVAGNGLEGLETFRRFKPDIVLTDVRMPVMDGLDMIAKIRETDKNTRIIILSAFGEPRYFLSAIELGVKAYLLKPIDTRQLIKAVTDQANAILLDKKVRNEEAKRREAESELHKSETILKALANITAIFFEEGFSAQSVPKVLQLIGEAADVSRVYIFQNFKDEQGKWYTSQIYEWVKGETVKPEINNPTLERLYFENPIFERWVKVMQHRGYISGYVRDFENEDERKILEDQDILSIISMPIYVKDQWWGFIGLDECERERTWSEAETGALKTLAHNLGAAIYRIQVENELRELNTHLEQRVKQRTEEMQKEIQVRRLAEMRLRESEEKYRLIFENANNGIILIIEGKIIMVNPKTLDILESKPSSIIDNCLLSFVFEEDKAVFFRFLSAARKKTEAEFLDLRFVTASGMVKWVEMKANYIIWNNEEASLIFLADISARKKAEEALNQLNKELENRVAHEVSKVKQQQQLLVQKSKLEYMGELSAGLSHEVNQPLGGISMGLDNILMRLEQGNIDKEYIRKKIQLLFKDIERIDQIIQHVRIFSRDQQESLKEMIDVAKVLQDALSLIRMQLKDHQIDLIVDCPAETLIVEGNPYRLEQVFLNLLSNARDAVEQKGKNQPASYKKKVVIRCLQQKQACKIVVRDNGSGISKENMDRIFDPFFTTKDEDKGTGLGLSISYGIIKEFGGEIEVESRQGEFTQFSVLIPLQR